MRLTEFRITNFRSINDSGAVKVSRVTSIVGRNESGKSNLLLALASLNPPGGREELRPVKDFPRDRPLPECKDETEVTWTRWELDDDEQKELAGILPRATGISVVTVSRTYKGILRVVLEDLDLSPSLPPDVVASWRVVVAAVEERMASASDELPMPLREPLDGATAVVEAMSQKAADWAAAVKPAIAAFRNALARAGAILPEPAEVTASKIEAAATAILGDPAAMQKAREWIGARLPVFVYVEEYPELEGHQNLDEYLVRKRTAGQLKPADQNFDKLCKVAGLDPVQLQALLGQNDPETRNQLVNRAGALVTRKLRELWKDRALKVRFALDAQHLDTIVSDANATYDVEVNLDERSRGLRWFFSFYIAFAADTQDGASSKAVMLLDEPGLFLHALSQEDLLRHFRNDFTNQILYTTHSPFMVPTDDLDSIRTVNIHQDAGTTVTDTPTGDQRTLFPLQMALGFSLSQSLFIGSNNLIVEGVTDFWMLTAVSEHLNGSGKTGLDKSITVTPAGGAQKVGYMVSLLTSERLRVVVLLDDERESRNTRNDLVKLKLIREDGVILVSSAFPHEARPAEADIEDLLDADSYEALVRESYKNELKGKTLTLNPSIPRVVKRLEKAFAEVGLEFHKTRPARLLLSKMGRDAAKVVSTKAASRFELLFATINAAHAKAVGREQKPFL